MGEHVTNSPLWTHSRVCKLLCIPHQYFLIPHRTVMNKCQAMLVCGLLGLTHATSPWSGTPGIYNLPLLSHTERLSTVFLSCSESYKGSRCEQFQLLITSGNVGERGLIAAVVIVALLLLVILAVVIYYACK